MIGINRKLSFDKANQIFSYFLKSIQIAHDHGGEVKRIWDFDNEMAAFCGRDPRQEDGEENRAWYNKSLFPRYYGFLDLMHLSPGKTGVVVQSTPRGERLLQLMESRADATDVTNDNALYIPTRNIGKAHELFCEALAFNSFGRNNTGAEESSSDVEPPKVMMRVIGELSKASKEEICYCIYALHRGECDSVDEAIERVRSNRAAPGFSYANILKDWGLKNIAGDFKLAKLLADPGISLLNMTRNESGHEYFSLSDAVPGDVREKFMSFDGVYHAMKWMFSINDMSGFQSWVRDVIAGSTHNDEEVFVVNLDSKRFIDDIVPNEFKEALLMAFKRPRRNVYFAVSAESQGALLEEMGVYATLVNRVEDFTEDYNGWSELSVEDRSIYRDLCGSCWDYRGPDGRKLGQILQPNTIKLPANFQFIGGVKHV